jgi:hypothetical protein
MALTWNQASARRSRAPLFFLALLVVGLALVALRSFVWEPDSMEVTRHTLPGPVAQRLRVAHVSDLHAVEFGSREHEVLRVLSLEKPDLVVLTGDLVDADRPPETLREFFRFLKAPLGVFVVRGEADRRGEHDERFYADVGATLLVGGGVKVRDDVWVVGLDHPAPERSAESPGFTDAPAAAYKIALFHAPDLFPQIAGLVHLALAGHAHGGQVRLPGVGPLFLPPSARRFPMGWFTENGTALYVSRGLGTTGVRARLLCRPEVAIIDIAPSR